MFLQKYTNPFSKIALVPDIPTVPGVEKNAEGGLTVHDEDAPMKMFKVQSEGLTMAFEEVLNATSPDAHWDIIWDDTKVTSGLDRLIGTHQPVRLILASGKRIVFNQTIRSDDFTILERYAKKARF